ncbi:MAG: hypothetical protein ACP5U2_05325 [Bryobacteraceae bacterium]
MSTTLAVAAALLLLIAVAFVLLFRRLASPGKEKLPDAEWWANFSLEKYRPMERLFARDDYEFLSAQPGFTPALARRLQAERRRILRRYLRCLNRDFDRLCTALKLLMLNAEQDRSELAIELFRQRLNFRLALAGVHTQLALQALGLGTVRVHGLVAALETMRERLQMLAAQPVAVPVQRG